MDAEPGTSSPQDSTGIPRHLHDPTRTWSFSLRCPHALCGDRQSYAWRVGRCSGSTGQPFSTHVDKLRFSTARSRRAWLKYRSASRRNAHGRWLGTPGKGKTREGSSARESEGRRIGRRTNKGFSTEKVPYLPQWQPRASFGIAKRIQASGSWRIKAREHPKKSLEPLSTQLKPLETSWVKKRKGAYLKHSNAGTFEEHDCCL